MFTLQEPQECQSSVNSCCLNVTSVEENDVAISHCTMSGDGPVTLLVGQLNESSSYKFTITSSNNIGEQSTTAVPFSKIELL